MAIYRFEARVVKRSVGRSVTAAAAYRAAEEIDERTGQVFDYRRRRGVMHAEILAPEDTPDWMRDREQLWNAVERAEKRKDAQLAREIELALPHELTPAQRLDLVRGFIGEEFVGRGMIADLAGACPRPAGRPAQSPCACLADDAQSDGGGVRAEGARLERGRAARRMA